MYKTGDRLDSELTLAKRYQTSVLTVREALSALAEQGIVDRRHGSGTYILDPLARQHVAVYTGLDISHPRTSYFYLRLIQQLRQMVRAAGYRVRLYVGEVQPGELAPEMNCPEFLEALEAEDVCGVVAVATAPGAWLAPLKERGVAVVGSTADFPYQVTTESASVIREGIERLILRGRRKLGFLGWVDHQATDLFSAVLHEHGLPVHPEWIRSDLHPSTEGAGWEEFRGIWLNGECKPDGLLIADDMLLTDAAAAILDLGIKVPDELAVVSHMNRGSLLLPPFPVDRMEYDPDMVAAAMGDRLLRAMRQEPVDQPQVVLGFRWRLATEPYGPATRAGGETRRPANTAADSRNDGKKNV